MINVLNMLVSHFTIIIHIYAHFVEGVTAREPVMVQQPHRVHDFIRHMEFSYPREGIVSVGLASKSLRVDHVISTFTGVEIISSQPSNEFILIRP